MNMSGQPLDLVLEFSGGTGELAVGTDHPAVAAFRRAMEEGQLTGTWRYLLVHNLPTVPYTILGTFVRTPKRPVLFFPGAAIAIETDDPTARYNGKRLVYLFRFNDIRMAIAAYAKGKERELRDSLKIVLTDDYRMTVNLLVPKSMFRNEVRAYNLSGITPLQRTRPA